MKVEDISKGLLVDADGIYYSPLIEPVSYTADGHEQCFEVEDASFWFRHRNNCISALVARHPFVGPMIDFGGGNGFVSQRLVSDGHEVVLLEPGLAGARNAKLERNLAHVIRATVDEAGFSPACAGAIGLFDVIEHVDDDAALLKKLAQLLRARGRLFLTVPCHQWLWSQADIDAGHFRRHTRASLSELLSEHFSIDYFSYFFSPLLLPQLLMRALPYRLGIKNNSFAGSRSHGLRESSSAGMLERLLKSEADLIRRGKEIKYGPSCLIAATVLDRSVQR